MSWLLWALLVVVLIAVIILALLVAFCWKIAVYDPIDHGYGHDEE